MSDTAVQGSSVALTEDQISQLFLFIKSKTGMVFAPRLKVWVLKQFSNVMQASGVSSPISFLLDLLGERRKIEAQALFESLTVHETMFYRDKKYFDFLEEQVFPDLIKKNEFKKSISVWVSAGSSGQEAYSILFTLLKKFPQVEGWRISVYSTDLSGLIIEKARKGIYENHEVKRGLEEEDLKRFFNKIDEKSYQVKDEFRSKVTFSISNLVSDFSHDVPDVDIISCRNVLIYFNDETKADIIQRISKKVFHGGYLLLGQVDYINCKLPPEGFEYGMRGTFPYYKKK